MKFTIFQADKGDCLLLESDDKKRILVDGGMPDAYAEHIAPAMGRLRQQNITLDLAYLSHIDQDHIGGMLKFMDDEAAWRVYDHQKSIGNTSVKPPTVPRPPKVKEIWHNAFHEQLGKNTGPISDMLAASARLLAASPASSSAGSTSTAPRRRSRTPGSRPAGRRAAAAAPRSPIRAASTRSASRSREPTR